MGIDMRLSKSLMDLEVSLNQPEELIEKMRLSKGLINLEVSLDQQMQLTKEEDLRNILMIGGIHIFLPFSQGEAKVYVADEVATTEVG
jgi:hypothetical protein